MDRDFKKYFFWAVLAVLIIISYLILKPYLIALISTFILAYLAKPVFLKLKPKFGKRLSAVICIVLVFFIVLVPTGFILAGVAQQGYNYLTEGNFKYILDNFSELDLFSKLNIDFSFVWEKAISFGVNLVTGVLEYAPTLLLSILIVFFGMYYILVDWDLIVKKIKKYSPFENKDELVREISETSNQIIYGTLFIAIIQLVIAYIGFLIFGIPYSLLLAVIVFIAAFIPGIGPVAVWVPLAIYYLFKPNYIKFTGVIIVGLILTIWADSIFRSQFLGKKSKINPFIMLLGVIGGISVFGIFGFIIGPIVLVYTLELIDKVLDR